ncbi:MAG TPA: glutamate--tRNA ligase [Steroidobacteraceae bacterium]|nr:glutamate--tRNA ligase [Steroidobacteraceae bacterium]
MSQSPITTRFAPSPTGELHLGNARTALFSWLFARHHGGRFVLRIEDTDTERSKEPFTAALMEDLQWMGLQWDCGPGRAQPGEEYHQSRRGSVYARHSATLDARDLTYPCYCTPLELDLSRKAQLAAGRPPRYAGTCRELSPEARVRKSAQGISPTTRFRVPTGRRVEFNDMVHGAQSFATDDIGDFILRRADGSAAFFFSNAIDDAEMGITHVLRGEDHLTNTPRQLLVLEALELRAPTYGHLSLLVGADGSPLSKRHGATSVREFRERGYLPAALANHLFRLGHSSSENGVLQFDAMARAFTVKHLGRAPARFEESQLNVWQREVAHHMPLEESERWLAAETPPEIDAERRRAFIAAIRPNVLLPADVARWREVVFGAAPALDESSLARVREAGPQFFRAAADAAATGGKLDAIVNAVKAATGARDRRCGSRCVSRSPGRLKVLSSRRCCWPCRIQVFINVFTDSPHDPHPQFPDGREAGTQARRARPRAHVQLRHDRLRLLPRRQRPHAGGVRHGEPLPALSRPSRHLRAQHHRRRRQDHQPRERDRGGLARPCREIHRGHVRGSRQARMPAPGEGAQGVRIHRRNAGHDSPAHR